MYPSDPAKMQKSLGRDDMTTQSVPKTEDEELAELSALLSVGIDSEDKNNDLLVNALYAKLTVFEENRLKADKAREARQKSALIIQEHAEQRVERARKLRDRAREKHGVAIEEHKASNLGMGRALREKEVAWKSARAKGIQEHVDRARALVVTHKQSGVVTKAEEVRQDALKRHMAHEERRQRDEAAKAKHERIKAEKVSSAAKIRDEARSARTLRERRRIRPVTSRF